MRENDSETILLEGDQKFHSHASVWLLWAAMASSITMHLYSFPFWSSQMVSWFFFTLWAVQTVPFATLFKNFFGAVVEVFFRDLQYHGLSNIPREGVPTLLVCAPHANQFVDPLVITKRIKRDVAFLTAANSLRKPFIGALIRATKLAVPVERPQDVAKACKGFVNLQSNEDQWKAIGLGGTCFKAEFKNGDLVSISAGEFKGYSARVKNVLSDSEMDVGTPKHPVKGLLEGVEETGACDAKNTPKLSQEHMYKDVCEYLANGKAVAIFPEGGSHDRTALLPLKAGIAYIALHAGQKYPDLAERLRILPVGITYSNAHRFRSRAFVDFGEPILLNKPLLFEYKKDPRSAASKLLDEIKVGLDLVTVQANDYEQMQRFRMLRRLYASHNTRLSIGEKISTTRAFARGYEQVKDDPKVESLMTAVGEYCDELKAFELRDHMVARNRVDGASTLLDRVDVILLLSYRFTLACFYILTLAPGILVSIPFLILTKVVSEKKQKEALAKSNVKIKARDVMATWKILTAIVFVPIIHFTYTIIVLLAFGWAPGMMYFFWMPFVAALSLKGTENLRKVLLSFRPLVLSLLQPRAAEKLVVKRQELVVKVRNVVQETDWGTVKDALSESNKRELDQYYW